MEQNPYPLTPQPPLAATSAAHAATLRATWFEVAGRSIEAWPVTRRKLNGKTQSDTVEVWACAGSLFGDDEVGLEGALDRLPVEFAAAVRARIPAAGEALRAVKAERAARARQLALARAQREADAA